MRRVLVIGPGGSGKSWLATRISEITGLPVVHLDIYYWRAGWRPTLDDEWHLEVEELIATDRWVMDGNYGGTPGIRLAACDTVIFLDLPRRITIWRVIRRWWKYRGSPRPDVSPGCPDRLTFEFLMWIWNYPRRRRPKVLHKLQELSEEQAVHILQSTGAADSFLRGLKKSL